MLFKCTHGRWVGNCKGRKGITWEYREEGNSPSLHPHRIIEHIRINTLHCMKCPTYVGNSLNGILVNQCLFASLYSPKGTGNNKVTYKWGMEDGEQNL